MFYPLSIIHYPLSIRREAAFAQALSFSIIHYQLSIRREAAFAQALPFSIIHYQLSIRRQRLATMLCPAKVISMTPRRRMASHVNKFPLGNSP
jgi:hypothetical protein